MTCHCLLRLLLPGLLIVLFGLSVLPAIAQQQDMHWVQRGNDSGYTIQFSNDGSAFITTGSDGIKRWETATGRLLDFISGYGSWYSSNAQYALIGSGQKLRLYDAETLQQIAEGDVGGYPSSFSFSSDGNYLLSLVGSTATLWRLPSLQNYGTVGGSGSVAAGFSPDSRHVLIGSTTNTVTAYDVHTRKTALVLPGGTEGASGWLGYVKGGTMLVGASRTTITLWDFNDQSKRSIPIAQDNWVYSTSRTIFAASPNGKHVAFARYDRNGGDSLVMIFDVDAGEFTTQLPFPSMRGLASALAFTPDGSGLAVASSDGVIRIYDPRTGMITRMLPPAHHAEATASAWSSDGRFIVSSGKDSRAILWDAVTGERLQEYRAQYDPIDAVAFSPDGSRIAAATLVSYLPMILIWDRTTGELVQSLPHTTGKVLSLEFMPDGMRLLSGGSEGIVRLWDLATGDPLQTFIGHGLPVHDLDVSSDGRRMASAGYDWTVKLWDVATGGAVRTFSGHRAPVYSVEFSPDGESLLTAGSDSTVREWTIVSAFSRTLRGHSAPVRSARYSTDGTLLYSAGDDGRVHAWSRNGGTIIHTYIDSILGSRQQFTSLSVHPQHKAIAATGADGSVLVLKPVDAISSVAVPRSSIDHALNLQVVPNPISSEGTIHFQLSSSGHCRITLTDPLGKEVAQITDTWRSSGTHVIDVNIEELPTGVYYLRVMQGDMMASYPVVVSR